MRGAVDDHVRVQSVHERHDAAAEVFALVDVAEAGEAGVEEGIGFVALPAPDLLLVLEKPMLRSAISRSIVFTALMCSPLG